MSESVLYSKMLKWENGLKIVTAKQKKLTESTITEQRCRWGTSRNRKDTTENGKRSRI